MVESELTGTTLRINALNWSIPTTVEDSAATMEVAVNELLKARDVTRLTISEAREIEYDEEQTEMLKELAFVYERLVVEEDLLSKRLSINPSLDMQRRSDLRRIVSMLKGDPIGAYMHLVKTIKKLEEKKPSTTAEKIDTEKYIDILASLKEALEKTKLISKARSLLSLYLPGDRSVYRKIFNPVIRPRFMLTRYVLFPPANSKIVERYYLPEETLVEIYQVPEKVRLFYYIIPREFMLPEEHYNLLDAARRQLMEHQPSEKEVVEMEKIRERFFVIGKNLLLQLASGSGVKLSPKDLNLLATILVRYTAGFGVLEILLSDKKIQDIYVNAPVESMPIFVNHEDFGECETNLIPTREDAESWATRFRLYSGRPLDEANPVLDTDLVVPGGRARVAAITRTLSPTGLAFAFRRHREKPWTFPLFIQTKYFNPLYAGLMSFIVDGGRAVMIAGGRGSGKTSLLSAMILEMMRRYRIIIQEDTPELPVEMYRKLGYDVLRLKSRSVITRVETELSPEEALRTALRLGDSALVVGEVRSKESTVLFEAMRIGALANVVAGTIHGESAYGVYDRVVHDLGVTPTSFKALDLITICNMLTSPDGLHRFRRVVELTEVRKHWKEDPEEEGGFVPLMQYSAKEDELKPTDTLLNGESEVLNAIAKRVREWHGSWDRVWENILLRAKIKETIVRFAQELNRPEILEAEWTVQANEAFHLISAKVAEEVGSVDSKLVYERWLEWFKERLKYGVQK